MATLYQYKGENKFKPVNGGQLLELSAGGPGPEPDPDPNPDPNPGPGTAPVSWQAAVDSQDISEIVLWYEAHTGFGGINPEDPDDTPLTVSDLTRVDSGVTTQHDGQVIEGVWMNSLSIKHNNVTVRRCRITDGATYGMRFNPTFDSNVHGFLMEFCTFDTADPTGWSSTSAGMMRSGNTTDHLATIRHCDVSRFSSGFRLEHKMTAEYNYFHDFYHPEGGHANCIRMMGGGGRSYRNLGTDGTSNVYAWYIGPNHSHVWDSQYIENIAGGTVRMPDGRVISPEASPSYGFRAGGSWQIDSYDMRIIGNRLYDGMQYGPIAGDLEWGLRGNYRYDNTWLTTDELAFSDYRPPGE